MLNSYFKKNEALSAPIQLDLNTTLLQLAYNEAGLIPVITQDATNKRILMFAWMNKQAIELTIASKKMTYWSRSRNKLWIKGETSGHVQTLKSMAFDCDGDAILCEVDQTGSACHTGREHCFYLDIDLDKKQVNVPPSPL